MFLFVFILLSGFTQGLNFCALEDTDLCIGVSGLEDLKTIAGAPLQLKSRYKSLLYDSTLRIQFLENENGSLTFSYGNETMFVDKAQKGSSLGILSKKSEGAVYVANRISLFNYTRCLTVARCVDGVCSPSVEKPELTTPKKGAFLFFLPCEEGLNSQKWLEDPPCHQGCTDDMLLNDVCDQECNYIECFSDFGACNSTLFPTSSPVTQKPTKRTKSPSQTPTKNPIVSLAPSVSPTVNATSSPSRSPHVSTSLSPSSHPGVVSNVTLVPTVQPSLNPTSTLSAAPTFLLTQSPTFSPPVETPTLPPSSPLTLPPSLPVLPQGSTQAPTGVASYFDPGWIALIVVAFILLFSIGGFIFYKRYYKKNTPPERLPTYPGRMPEPTNSVGSDPTPPPIHGTQAFV